MTPDLSFGHDEFAAEGVDALELVGELLDSVLTLEVEDAVGAGPLADTSREPTSKVPTSKSLRSWSGLSQQSSVSFGFRQQKVPRTHGRTFHEDDDPADSHSQSHPSFMTCYEDERTIRTHCGTVWRSTCLVRTPVHIHEPPIASNLSIAHTRGQADIAVLLVGSTARADALRWVAWHKGIVKGRAITSIACLSCRRGGC